MPEGRPEMSEVTDHSPASSTDAAVASSDTVSQLS